MRKRQVARIAILGLGGLALAGGLGYAAHVAAGDEVGLPAGGVEAGTRLAPPEAARPDPAATTNAVSSTATESSSSPSPTRAEAGADTAAPAQPTATTGPPTAAARGREVFARVDCGSCHTLAAAGATGDVGPDLDRLAPTRAEVLAQVREGGGGMPSFAGRLTEAEIADVATFVAARTAPSAPSAPPAAPPADTVDDDRASEDRSGNEDSSGRGRGRGRGGDDERDD